jgi:D-amino peptidase
MKVLIASDMEGVAGITNWDQVSGGANGNASSQNDEGRLLYTAEINAAIEGARSGGATENQVMDCHGAGHGWSFNSLVLDELDPDVEVVVQREWTDYTELLEEGCEAALLVGMHARAGTPDGVLNHTVHGSAWLEVCFNGTPVGEIGINAALVGTWDCPVALVTGDRATCREGRELLGGGVTTVEVKRGFGRESARHLSPKRARELIRAGAETALGNLGAASPYDPGQPCAIEVELTTTQMVEQFRHHETIEIVAPKRIRCEAEDWWTAWKRFFFNYQWPEGW